jgi:hypothetical protein
MNRQRRRRTSLAPFAYGSSDGGKADLLKRTEAFPTPPKPDVEPRQEVSAMRSN